MIEDNINISECQSTSNTSKQLQEPISEGQNNNNHSSEDSLDMEEQNDPFY